MQKEIKYVLMLMLAMFGYVVISDQGWIGKASVVAPGVDSTGAPITAKNVCGGGETQSLTVRGYLIDDKTTADTSTLSYRRTDSVSWTEGTLGTGITGLSTGSDYEFVVADLTTHTDTTHGPHFIIKNLPCTVEFGIPVYPDEDESGTTFTWYNNDGDASAESWSANEVQRVSFKLKSTAEQYFGNPTLVSLDPEYISIQNALRKDGTEITFETPGVANPNICYYQLNETEWDKPDQVYMLSGNEKISLGSGGDCPGRLSSSSGSKNYCYHAPIVQDYQIEIHSDLNTDDSTAPATDDTFGCFAATYFINGNTGELEYGVEDEDDNAVGVDAAETATIDNT
jgi:hypothetical protein